jgi:glyoxylate reductase
MAKVFVTRMVPGNALAMLAESGHEIVTWDEPLPVPRKVLEEQLCDASAALTMLTERIDPALLGTCPTLRIVANMAVGYDNIDAQTAAMLGIWVTNTPGVLTETTADFAFALLLAAARNVALSERETRAGAWKTWSPTDYLGVDAFGATLGIIGMGAIGAAMARRARGFQMRVLYTSRTRKPDLETGLGLEWVERDQLLAESDFISVHTALNSDTRHSLSAAQFALMKPSAILINTARGQVIDQDALVEALRAGRPGGAALDVTDPEPLPVEHPLFTLPNVVITPHIGSASIQTRSLMAEMAARNILAVLDGREPLNPVNRPETPRPASG